MIPGGVRPDRAVAGLNIGGGSLATHLEQWAERLGDEVALTYLDYRASVDGSAVSLTWRELDERVSAVAAWVQRRVTRGGRVAVLAPQSADYVVAFLGAIRAGATAVPLFAPDLPGHGGRLAAALADCAPDLLLTTKDEVAKVENFLTEQGIPLHEVVAVDLIPTVFAREYELVQPRPDDLAYLQYTSGSTRTPSGVLLTHHNVLANAAQACSAYGVESGRTSNVSWLPLFHDMGLILAVGAPIFGGTSSLVMDPIAFLERPGRWLRALSSSIGAISAAPNFAYAYSASRVPDREKVYLDLGHVVSLINGSEPVLPSTIARFQDAFAECGLKPAVHRSSYGLAEATVLVSVTTAGAPPREMPFDRDSLAAGRAVPAKPGSENVSTLVSCGHAVDQRVRIVNGATHESVEHGVVGEIWVSGPNIGQGYWGRPDAVGTTFGLALTVDGTADEGVDGRGWLATGDLGMVFDGELYMTGRIKDLIIVDGRNHYPQDIEQTVQAAHPAVRPHGLGAFAVPGEDGEVVVVALERSKLVDRENLDGAEVAAALRSAVSAQHGVRLHEVLVLEPGQVPRTSSGKISRAACRQRYLAGSFSGRPAE